MWRITASIRIIVVEQDPKAVSEGHDPQLEKAVSLALEELAQGSEERSAEAGLSELSQGQGIGTSDKRDKRDNDSRGSWFPIDGT